MSSSHYCGNNVRRIPSEIPGNGDRKNQAFLFKIKGLYHISKRNTLQLYNVSKPLCKKTPRDVVNTLQTVT